MSGSTTDGSNFKSEDENEIDKSSNDRVIQKKKKLRLDDKLISLWRSLPAPQKEGNLVIDPKHSKR